MPAWEVTVQIFKSRAIFTFDRLRCVQLSKNQSCAERERRRNHINGGRMYFYILSQDEKHNWIDWTEDNVVLSARSEAKFALDFSLQSTINILFFSVRFANQRLNAKYILSRTLTYNHICTALIVPFPRFAWYCCAHTLWLANEQSNSTRKKKNTWHFVFAPFACSIFRFNRNIKTHFTDWVVSIFSCVYFWIFLFFSSSSPASPASPSSSFSSSLFSVSIFGYIWKRFRRQRWREIRDEIDQWCVNQTM